MDYRVILYYFFTPLENPEAIREEQFDFCEANHLKGRILIAQEGINGTVSGKTEDVEAYMNWMSAHPIFQGIEFKVDEYDKHTFLKLHVRVKNEIVRFEVPVDTAHKKGKYVEPEEFREVLKQAETDEDIVILDARSSYEYNLGKFKNALTLGIDNFRELPERLEALKALKDKKIYTYCTGGIKCEKVSVWLQENGFENVYQLHGGIVRYGKEAGGEDFEGQCYVFDQRVVVPVNTVNPKTIANCKLCGTPTEKMINCANAECNEHFLICDSCAEEHKGCCSHACAENERTRQYDGRGYYLRGVNSKNYVHK